MDRNEYSSSDSPPPYSQVVRKQEQLNQTPPDNLPQYSQGQPVVLVQPPLQPPVAATFVQVNHSFENPDGVYFICPECQFQGYSRTIHYFGFFAWLVTLILLMFCLWICALIVCCLPGCHDVEHRCPRCNRFLGVYRR